MMQDCSKHGILVFRRFAVVRLGRRIQGEILGFGGIWYGPCWDGQQPLIVLQFQAMASHEQNPSTGFAYRGLSQHWDPEP